MRNIKRGWCLIKRADATIVVSKVVVDAGGFFFVSELILFMVIRPPT